MHHECSYSCRISIIQYLKTAPLTLLAYTHTLTPSPPHPHPSSQAEAPDTSKIPAEDVVGVTVVLLTCSYKTNEFVRVGYYVNNEYTDPEVAENPPAKAAFDKV